MKPWLEGSIYLAITASEKLSDYQHVLTGGPLVIGNHCPTIRDMERRGLSSALKFTPGEKLCYSIEEDENKIQDSDRWNEGCPGLSHTSYSLFFIFLVSLSSSGSGGVPAFLSLKGSSALVVFDCSWRDPTIYLVVPIEAEGGCFFFFYIIYR